MDGSNLFFFAVLVLNFGSHAKTSNGMVIKSLAIGAAILYLLRILFASFQYFW